MSLGVVRFMETLKVVQTDMSVEVGFNLLIDRTGKLLRSKTHVARKDVINNPRAFCLNLAAALARFNFRALWVELGQAHVFWCGWADPDHHIHGTLWLRSLRGWLKASELLELGAPNLALNNLGYVRLLEC